MAEQTCKTCSGTGMVDCQGCSGTVRSTVLIEEAKEKEWSSCARCHGRGSLPCSRCGGSGKS